MDSKYILLDSSVVPEVFRKVIKAKRLISSGKYKSIKEILKKVDLSRSTFYKYKDHVFPYSKLHSDNIANLAFELEDVSGVLSSVLGILSGCGANVLTINQDIPINGIANVTVSVRTDNMAEDISSMLEKIKNTEGVSKAEILAIA